MKINLTTAEFDLTALVPGSWCCALLHYVSLTRTKALLMLPATPVLFPLWQVKVSAVKGLFTAVHALWNFTQY